jgi:hypothetical protein
MRADKNLQQCRLARPGGTDHEDLALAGLEPRQQLVDLARSAVELRRGRGGERLHAGIRTGQLLHRRISAAEAGAQPRGGCLPLRRGPSIQGLVLRQDRGDLAIDEQQRHQASAAAIVVRVARQQLGEARPAIAQVGRRDHGEREPAAPHRSRDRLLGERGERQLARQDHAVVGQVQHRQQFALDKRSVVVGMDDEDIVIHDLRWLVQHGAQISSMRLRRDVHRG